MLKRDQLEFFWNKYLEFQWNILNLWKLTRDQLNQKVRDVWAGGFRPGKDVDGSVGSGFDTSDGEDT